MQEISYSLAMEDLDDVRKLILEKSKAGGGNGKGALREWSLSLGKNETYLQQFITKGSPRNLAEDVREKLAALMHVDESDLKLTVKGATQKLPAEKLEGPKRTPVTFYVKEWRKFCEVSPSSMAKALGIDGDDYGLLENKPYRFSIEQLVVIADTLKIQFDSMRWNPEKLPAPQPAKKDIERINKARGRK